MQYFNSKHPFLNHKNHRYEKVNLTSDNYSLDHPLLLTLQAGDLLTLKLSLQ